MKEEERMTNAIIKGIAEKLGDTLPGILLTMMSADAQLNRSSLQRKMSCQEEYLHPAPRTPPSATCTGGTRGRSPSIGSGNGRKKATKNVASPTPPTRQSPFAPLPPLPLSGTFTPPYTPLLIPYTPPYTPPSPLSPLSPLSFLSKLERSTPEAELSMRLSTAKKIVSELIDLVDDVREIFPFPTDEEDFMAEKKRYYKYK